MAVNAPNASSTSKSISTEPKISTEPGPIIGDMLIPDDINRSNIFYRSPPGDYDTSEYMIGDVIVGVILMESNGSIDPSTEDWTYGRSNVQRTYVSDEIQAGLNWWAAREPNAHLTFTYDINYGVPTSYEPITRPATDQWLWIDEATDYLGYPNDGFTGVRDYVNGIRSAYNKDWAFAIFVVNSDNDADGTFTDGYFAYAYLGGPFMVMTYDNNNYGIDNMDAVTAHETGHIFYALDEYSGSSPGPIGRSGYLNIENQNHQDGGSSNVACIMRGQVSPYTDGNICTYTRQMIGWRDTDGDGILDIVDNIPDSSLNAYSPDPTNDNTPTYTGSASEVPYPNSNPYGMGNDVSINTITNVQYRVDSGNWISTTASDGAFDEYSEDYTFTTSALLDSTHTIEVRATNSVGNIETTYASDTITIETMAPTVTAVTPTANETDVSVTTTVTKTFSELMSKTATEAASNLYSDGNMTPVAGTKSWSGNQLIFTPGSPLSWDTKYWANVSTVAKDLAGNPLASANNTWFRTIPRAVASATGPSGYSNISSITLTYTYIGVSDNVSIYYTMDGGITWGFIGNDTTVDGSYAWVAPLDGIYDWYVVANGGGSTEITPINGTAPEAYPFILDTVPPTMVVTGVVDGKYYNISVTPTIDIIDPNLNTTNITLNDVPFDNGTIVTEEGNYVLSVQATDKANNIATKTLSFSIDKTNPVIDITGVANNAYFNVSVTPIIEITDINLNTSTTTLNNETFASGTTITEDGDYILVAQAIDKAGNTMSKTVLFTIDKIFPEITIAGVANGAYYNISVTPIIDIIDPNLNTTTITLNEELFVSGTVVSAEGDYILFVQAVDKANNVATKTVSFTIDTPPSIVITGAMGNVYYNISITPIVEFNDTNLNITTITLNDVSFDSGTTITIEGDYVLVAYATDRAGNTASKTISFTIDKTSPEIKVAGIANNAYYNVNVTPVVNIIDSNLNITLVELNDALFTSGTEVINEGEHMLFVQAADKAGNIAQQTIVFTIDKTQPSITITNVATGAYYNASVTPGIEIIDANLNTPNITLNGIPFTSGTRIMEEGNYILSVETTDKAGNTATKTISFTIDKTPPPISELSHPTGAKTTEKQITISGKTEPNATVKINNIIVEVSEDGSFTKTIALGEGENKIIIEITDQAGNVKTQTITIIKETPTIFDLVRASYIIITIIVIVIGVIIGGVMAIKMRRAHAEIRKTAIEIPLMKLRCPRCKRIFEIEKAQKRPFKIKCPSCGTEGVVR